VSSILQARRENDGLESRVDKLWKEVKGTQKQKLCGLTYFGSNGSVNGEYKCNAADQNKDCGSGHGGGDDDK
jgi:hypothetical protein